MSTTGWGTPTAHPVQAAASVIRAALKDVADVQATFMSPDQLATALAEVTAAKAQLAELECRLLAAGEPLAYRDGARDIGTWVAHRLRTDQRGARADQRLAQALDRRWGRLATGMRDGEVNPDQARVIAAALEDLPADLDPGLVASAEERLVGYAQDFGPEELRRLGRRILEVIAPEIAETELAKALEREEQRGEGDRLGAAEAARGRPDPDHHHRPRHRGRPAQDLSRGIHLSPDHTRPHRHRHRARRARWAERPAWAR